MNTLSTSNEFTDISKSSIEPVTKAVALDDIKDAPAGADVLDFMRRT